MCQQIVDHDQLSKYEFRGASYTSQKLLLPICFEQLGASCGWVEIAQKELFLDVKLNL